MKYKPFTSKHCTPSRFTSPLKKAGFPTTEESKKPEGEVRPISDLGITEKDLRLGGTLPVSGGGYKGLLKDVVLDKVVDLGKKAIKKYKESR
jgi:hypothetical protein